MRIFLDANILFSASKSAGAVRRLVALLLEEQHELWADAFVVEEARRNLTLKFPAAIPELEVLLGSLQLAPTATRAELPAELLLLLPEKDRPVLAAAMRTGCDTLMTGDRAHFGALYGRTLGGVVICSPQSLAERALGSLGK